KKNLLKASVGGRPWSLRVTRRSKGRGHHPKTGVAARAELGVRPIAKGPKNNTGGERLVLSQPRCALLALDNVIEPNLCLKQSAKSILPTATNLGPLPIRISYEIATSASALRA